jgi:hypothetical protein
MQFVGTIVTNMKILYWVCMYVCLVQLHEALLVKAKKVIYCNLGMNRI